MKAILFAVVALSISGVRADIPPMPFPPEFPKERKASLRSVFQKYYDAQIGEDISGTTILFPNSYYSINPVTKARIDFQAVIFTEPQPITKFVLQDAFAELVGNVNKNVRIGEVLEIRSLMVAHVHMKDVEGCFLAIVGQIVIRPDQ